MAWCNNYTATAARQMPDDIYGPDPYDLNISFPIDTRSLENERVKLAPFVPRQHMDALYDRLAAHPELYRYLPFSAPKSIEEIANLLEQKFRRIKGNTCFAIFDKTHPGSSDFEIMEGGSFAGTIGLLDTSTQNLSTEIGYIIVFPPFQRTHVLSNAAGLLLRYFLNLPSDEEAPGLGFRRVQWVANSRNERSIGAAERLGFHREGTLRWNWVLPEDKKEGNTPRQGDPAGTQKLGRDSAILSICWDDWVNGAKDKVEKAMKRVA